MLLSNYPDITSLTYDNGSLKIVTGTEYSSVDLVSAIDEFSPITTIYNSDELIAWALTQNFAAEIMAHMAAFLDFANKASVSSRDNFLAYATVVDLISTANTIIAKAIELGANI